MLSPSISQSPRVISASRISEKIQIDADLSESAWKNADVAQNFTQTEPVPGKAASFQTDVHFLYDDNAIYIGAFMHDPEPDKILRELSLRDNFGNADNFGVFLDTYKSGLNGFMFFVTASGVQMEAVVTANNDDANWNAVWESAVQITDGGWIAEFKIPYSSLRFPTSDIQEWRIQFGREVRRFREQSYWSPINPAINGWVQQSGTVKDIRNIKSPVRLSLTPYISGYLNTTYDPQAEEGRFSAGNAYTAGLDLKYGLSDAFTLDMTLIPDFGQVISDRQVLNLSPFEVFFEENRQFFTEGTELFNRGRLFYSRRIGGRPLHYYSVYNQLKEGEEIVSNPETTQLFNATKVSGRTDKGTGIGLFNALVGESNAIIKTASGTERSILTNPMTNYNAFVVDQNLPNNSYVSLINTNVYRLGEDYDANVTGGFFNFKTKDQKYYIGGSGAMSQKFFAEGTDRGHMYNISAGKISGNWTYDAGHGVESEDYDPNDAGFLFSPNEKYWYASGGFTQYKPRNQKLQQYNLSSSVYYSNLFKPQVFADFAVEMESFILWKSRNAIGLNTRIEPIETRDYFEPRTSDFSKYLIWPVNYNLGGFISTDYRKTLAFDIRANYRWFDFAGRNTVSVGFNPRIRFNDQFSVFISTSATRIMFEPGYVTRPENIGLPPIDVLSPKDVLMGIRNRLIVDNALTGRYIFNSVMGINIRVRHYWDKVLYQSFGVLGKNGYPQKVDFSGLSNEGVAVYDRNVNIFNIDMQYNWRFAPGSDIIIVWKNQIFNTDAQYSRDYLQNFSGLFDATQSNNLSVRFLYFLDYLYLFPKRDS
jgi:hypothetical protein